MAAEPSAPVTASSARPPSGGRPWTDRLTTPSGLLLVAALILAAFPVTSAIRDPDFWWHLRTGQLILDRGGLLGTDPYTYTVPGHVWTMHEWGTEAVFAVLRTIGGLGLIVAVLSVVTYLGVIAVVMRARLRSPHPAILALGILVGVVAGYPIWGPRAQMITFAFACVTLLLVERFMVRGGRGIWLLVPLFLLWSNLHSGFVIGLAFGVVMVVAELAGGLLGFPDSPPRRRLLTLLYVGVACTLVAMINPNGPQIVLYPFGTVSSPAQQSLILEWHSPDFHGWEVRGFAAMLVSVCAMIVVNRRIRARDAALVAVTAALALQSVRNIALFVAAATPVWIEQLDLLLRTHAPRFSRPRPLPPRPVRLTLLAVIAVLLLGTFAALRLAPALAVREESLFYARQYPVCAALWLERAPHPLRIFNQYGEGGYLAYTLSSRGDKVFIFGDAALMGDDLLYTYGKVEAATPEWERILTQYGTDVVLFDDGTPLTHLLEASPRWVTVYKDDHNEAFAPRDRVASLDLPPQPPAADLSPACAELQSQGAGSGG